MRWIWVIFFLLFAGAGANFTSAYGGALTFDMANPLSWTGWNDGSAFVLLAGASAGDAFTFIMYISPSGPSWTIGSAYIYQ